MEIQYKDYVLHPSAGAEDRFDLYKKITITDVKSKKVGQTKLSLIGYAFTLPNALNRIIHLLLAEKKGDSSLPGWITEYKSAMADLVASLPK